MADRGGTRKRTFVPPERLLSAMKLAVAITTAAILVWIGWLVYQQKDKLEDAEGTIISHSAAIKKANEKQAELDEALDQANARLRRHDLPPVPVPPPTPPSTAGQRGPRGFPGPGPTRAQVAAAVATECADGCTSVQQIAAAVERYCAANVCGTQGEAGAQGPAGPVGPGATDDQVQAQVDAYCAANPCGSQGPKGDPGTALPGQYACAEGEVMRGFTVAEDGAVTLECVESFPPVHP
jgi:hypothetical protein